MTGRGGIPGAKHPAAFRERREENEHLEVMVYMARLLLPFTHGIDASAITSAFALAYHLGATLVPLSLISLPQPTGKGPRWEDIEQSRDFLEFVHHKAVRSGVSVERIERYTPNPIRTIRALAQEMECAGIILVVRRGAGVLLATYEVKQLLEDERIPLYVVPLNVGDHPSFLPRWFSRWFRKT